MARPSIDLPKDRTEDRENIKSHIQENKLAKARELLGNLKSGLGLIKDRNQDPSGNESGNIEAR